MSDLIVMVLNRHTKYRMTVFIKIALVHSYDTKKGESISVHVLNSRSILFVTSYRRGITLLLSIADCATFHIQKAMLQKLLESE